MTLEPRPLSRVVVVALVIEFALFAAAAALIWILGLTAGR